MLIKIIKKIPFVVSALAFINIIAIKIIEYGENARKYKQLKIMQFIFNHKSPFYFNYWLIYIIFAIIISLILALLRKYSTLEIIISIGMNLVLFIVVLVFIANRM